ncbi:hypothetical protein [Hymenobacter defluvii]|uniref:Uncharacterized protein n=1 Tax=Hymenobacter defluvii TaxID=2054411 RepID=A0ABS3TEW0_9BACT|nr:hypothetical protein [Hymenobacter defluvii]MBO3272194.1 hypothetical protein [Hymenobacter defluvii]
MLTPPLFPTPDHAADHGTPHYGTFGTPEDAAESTYCAEPTDGSNDNPDEFSELRGPQLRTEQYCMPGAQSDPARQRGHVEMNQNVAAVQAAQDGTPAEQKAAYALDDPRMAGGDVFDLRDEQTGW